MAVPFELTVAQAASLIRDRSLSPVELMESLLSQTSTLEPVLRVWETMDPDAAMKLARQRERELYLGGGRGPLHGVPLGIKDIFYTNGIKTTAGSPIYADFVPEYDATAVALIKVAGAIVMGKTVTTEFACNDPPATRNPWNISHTPGGSSSGSAVGTAVRMFPAALGSQTAGSVLRPASYNGAVGLKPNFGRISRFGVMPVSASLDTVGTFTRTVEDAALLLGVLAGQDPRDSSSSPMPVPDYTGQLKCLNKSPRFGLVRRFFYEESSEEVRRNFDGVVAQFEDAGAEVSEVDCTANFDALLTAHNLVAGAEAAAHHKEDFQKRPDDYAPNVRTMIEDGMRVTAVDYLHAQQTRATFRKEMEEVVRGFDALLCPTTPTPAPVDLTGTGDPAFQKPWTNCGYPSITIPSGLSESRLPMGIQLASRPFAEASLLASAHWCEKVLGMDLRPPVLS